ncbi:MAG: hypothetical protein IKS76_03985 [Paludibacteraceae bacterium]|nr:hypothetical protein [Paludibacteraceae bacterium]
MRRLLCILFCSWGLAVYAADYTACESLKPPTIAIQSVNNTEYMTTGSTYSSEVYDVGSNSPTTRSSSVRKAGGPGGGDNSGYDPNNPQFAPLGDAILPLLLLALAFMGLICLRKSKNINHQTSITNDK